MLIELFVVIVVFCIAWLIISILPTPASTPLVKTILYILLGVAAILYLLRFIA